MATSVASVARQAPKPTRVPPATAPPVTRTSSAIAPAFATAPPVMRLNAGKPLDRQMRRRMEKSFGANLGGVRVHGDAGAAATADRMGAKAFAVGSNIVLGSRARADDLGLMAHETAHTLQQRSNPTVQRFSRGAGDAHESEARQASTAVVRGQRFAVMGRTSAPRVQGDWFDLPDPLDWIANKANIIPGFRMFTIILGVNPINMSAVDSSPANILRALIEIMPGGGLITQALDNSGVFEKVAAWGVQQVKALGLVGSAIKEAVTSFIAQTKLTELITNPGGVWERGKRIFTDPIDRIKSFVEGLVDGIIQFVKDAILKPLAVLASKTKGWDLLCAVLGTNPITGESVSPSPDLLIGGFMKLIGQEEVWARIQKTGAIGRCWAWFQSTMKDLVGFVKQIPTLAINAFKSLELWDIVLVPRALIKVGAVFANFLGDFFSWAGTAMWNLLEIVFDVVSPGAFGYIKKTGDALKSILKNPLPFVGNLVKAAKLGFQRFSGNFLEHLKKGLIDWLTGSLPGVYIPKAISLPEVGKFALSVLGITWAQIRGKIVTALGPNGEKIMAGLEFAFDVIKALVTGGPAAAWEVIKDKLTALKDQVIEGITSMVVDTIVTKAVPKLLAMFIPGAGFISAIISIYDTIMVFVDKISKIIQVVTGFINSIVAIANGVIDTAAAKVESVLAGLLSLAISFLAGFAGLGKVADKVMGVVKKVQTAVDKAIDAAIAWIIAKAKALFAKLFGKKDKDEKDPEKAKLITAGLAAIDAADQAALKDGGLDKESAEKVAASVKQQHPVFKSLTVIETKDRFDYDYVASPGKKKAGAPKNKVGALGITRKSLSFTAATKADLIVKFKAAFPPGQLGQWKDAKLDIRHKVSISDTIKHLDAALAPMSIADATAALTAKGFAPQGKGRPGIIAAAREHLQLANNDPGNLFVGAAGKNRRKGKRYDAGDAATASATDVKHDTQKSKFISDYGFEGTDFVVTIDITDSGTQIETWTITP